MININQFSYFDIFCKDFTIFLFLDVLKGIAPFFSKNSILVFFVVLAAAYSLKPIFTCYFFCLFLSKFSGFKSIISIG